MRILDKKEPSVAIRQMGRLRFWRGEGEASGGTKVVSMDASWSLTLAVVMLAWAMSPACSAKLQRPVPNFLSRGRCAGEPLGDTRILLWSPVQETLSPLHQPQLPPLGNTPTAFFESQGTVPSSISVLPCLACSVKFLIV